MKLSDIPLRFKGGVDARSIKCREASLAARTGWLSANREAHLTFLKLPTTPAAPLRNGTISLMAQPPLLLKELLFLGRDQLHSKFLSFSRKALESAFFVLFFVSLLSYIHVVASKRH